MLPSMHWTAKGRKSILLAIIVIMVIALIGATLAVIYASSPGLILFELITFGIGVTALLLAVIGSVNSAYQIRVTRRISKEMHQAISEIEDVGRTNDAIRRRLNQDYALAKDIAEALAEAGVIEDDAMRRDVAGRVEQKVRKNILSKAAAPKPKATLKPTSKPKSKSNS